MTGRVSALPGVDSSRGRGRIKADLEAQRPTGSMPSIPQHCQLLTVSQQCGGHACPVSPPPALGSERSVVTYGAPS